MTGRGQIRRQFVHNVRSSEFGGSAPFVFHGDSDTRWTEEYQANLYEHQLKMVKRIPSLAGLSPWVLMDFHPPRRLLPGVQDYRNRKGVISDQGNVREPSMFCRGFIAL